MNIKCPLCSKQAQESWRPFCSKRCKEIDLGRWFSETYSLPSEDPIESDDQLLNVIN